MNNESLDAPGSTATSNHEHPCDTGAIGGGRRGFALETWPQRDWAVMSACGMIPMRDFWLDSGLLRTRLAKAQTGFDVSGFRKCVNDRVVGALMALSRACTKRHILRVTRHEILQNFGTVIEQDGRPVRPSRSSRRKPADSGGIASLPLSGPAAGYRGAGFLSTPQCRIFCFLSALLFDGQGVAFNRITFGQFRSGGRCVTIWLTPRCLWQVTLVAPALARLYANRHVTE